jgi:hypothetical protein
VFCCYFFIFLLLPAHGEIQLVFVTLRTNFISFLSFFFELREEETKSAIKEISCRVYKLVVVFLAQWSGLIGYTTYSSCLVWSKSLTAPAKEEEENIRRALRRRSGRKKSSVRNLS